jgi:hypothetical protein
MTLRRLTCSGWLAMTSAVLVIPWLLLSFVPLDRSGVCSRIAQGVLVTAGTALTVYLLVTLRRLLHERHAFSAADSAISFLVTVNLVSAAASLLVAAAPRLETALDPFGLILAVVGGLCQVMFGIKLLRLPDSLGGLRRPYCYLNVVTGLCLATIVLLPLGMAASAVADVMLGTIFFQSRPSP